MTKKIKYLLILFLLISEISIAQKTLKIRANSKNTKNAVIWDMQANSYRFIDVDSKPLYNHPDFVAQEWTWDGIRGCHKSLMQFNLSKIPKYSKIQKATLSLYAYPNSQSCKGHQTISGSNECYLERITEYWNPYTCCWENQPKVSRKNKVLLKKSQSRYDDYLNIDVTKLIQDMINKPNESFGFRISLVSKKHYRAMSFMSPNHKNSKKHPVLVIKYKPSKNKVEELSNNKFKFEKESDLKKIATKTKNVKTNHIDVAFDYDNGNNSQKVEKNNCGFEIKNKQKYQILEYNINSKDTIYINKNELQKGTYQLKVYEDNSITIKTIIIK